MELFVNVVDPWEPRTLRAPFCRRSCSPCTDQRIPLSELIPLGREHVRWVAMECKASLLKQETKTGFSRWKRFF